MGGSSDVGDELGDVVMNSIALVNARMFVRCGENSDIGDVMSDELVMVIMIYLILKMRVYMYAFTTKSRIKSNTTKVEITEYIIRTRITIIMITKNNTGITNQRLLNELHPLLQLRGAHGHAHETNENHGLEGRGKAS